VSWWVVVVVVGGGGVLNRNFKWKKLKNIIYFLILIKI
jgi:hypothetical protein